MHKQSTTYMTIKALILALTLMCNSVAEIPVAGTSAPAVPVTDKNEENASKQANITAIKKHDVTITVNMIIPSGMPSVISNDGYTISVKDGKVKAHLPYFGEAHTAMMPGADEMGIVFDDCPVEIKEDYSKAETKGRYVWNFKAQCGNENVDVCITLFDNGSADVNCLPGNRSSISYSGSFGE